MAAITVCPAVLALASCSTVATPAQARPLRVNSASRSVRLVSRRRLVVVAATPPSQLDDKIVEAIKGAEETCKDGATGECAAAWDEVEEISAARAHIKAKPAEDPLEKYCDDNPEADECRVYED